MSGLKSFLDIAPYLGNPLILTGFVLFLFFGIHRILIKSGIILPLKPRDSGNILQRLLRYGFIIALVVIMLGFALEFFKIYHGTRLQVETGQINQDDDYTICKNSNTTYKNKSINELVSILELRAKQILKVMEQEKLDAISSIAKGGGIAGLFSFLGPLNPDKAKFLKNLKASRAHFIDLHKKHISAIKAGQFVLAHEILNDIHVLLIIRNENTLSSAYRNPSAFYDLSSTQAPPYGCYSGNLPINISKEVQRLAAEIWDNRDYSSSLFYKRWAKLKWQVNHYHPVVAMVVMGLVLVSPILLLSLKFSRRLRETPWKLYTLRGLILIGIAGLLYEFLPVTFLAVFFCIIGIAFGAYGIFLRVKRTNRKEK